MDAQTSSPSSRPFGHAVVIGGSIAGLLGARVLSEHFQKVTVLERDAAPEGAEPRKGAPQGRHIHALLEAGLRTMEALLPGLSAELEAQGALRIDVAADTAWYHSGSWKPRFPSDLTSILCTRPLLEAAVRRRVAALPNVELRFGVGVEEPLTDAARTHVTGVRLKGPAGEETLAASLVVDASGRGTRAPRWLEALGYGRPGEEEVTVDVAYTSRLYARPAGTAQDWRIMALYPRCPHGWRTGFITQVEGDRWLVSVNGAFGDHPPTDEAGFLDFVRGLPTQDIYDVIKDARPLTPPVSHRLPSSRWLHYERLPRLLDGLVVLGDAVCSFNPVYGQGMTVSSLGARLLGECLARQARTSPGDVRGLAARFQHKLAGTVRLSWLLATLMDLGYPQTHGVRPPGLSLVQATLLNLLDLCSRSADAYRAFLEVVHMRRGVEALLSPRLLLSSVAYALRSRGVPLASRANTDRRPTTPRPPAAVAPVRLEDGGRTGAIDVTW